MTTEKSDPTCIEKIMALLPQTQCGHCGFDDCRAYAEAIVSGHAAINRCPTGGQTGIHLLAQLLNRDEPLLDSTYGTEKPRAIACIDTSKCIGCTLCLPVCPVDAILGTRKNAHTIIESDCTGCERCVASCPVDCIEMHPVSGTRTGWDAWSFQQAQHAREKYERKQKRRQEEQKQIMTSSTQAGQARKSDILKKIMGRAKTCLNTTKQNS